MIGLGPPLVAQAAPRIHVVNDSVIVDLVGRAIMAKSSDLFERATREGTQVALEVSLPSGAASYQWQRFLDQFMVSARGRDLLTPDNFKYVVDASNVLIGRDTIRAYIDVGLRTRCRGRWLQDGYRSTFTWVRRGEADQWERVMREPDLAYDSFGCPINPR